MKDYKFSRTALRMKSSIIRELLKEAMNPGMISFGGGVPDPETFPRKELAQIANKVISEEYSYALQYCPTEGDHVLRKAYLEYLERADAITGLNLDNIIVTVGSQSALHLISEILLDEDSIYFVSKPIYLGAASAFALRSTNHEDLELQDDGINLDRLERRLAEIENAGEMNKVKFIYVIPNFHNPAGVSLSLEKRKKLIEIAEKYDLLIIEDDPYGELRYEGEHIPSLFKLAGKERVLMFRTFSKVLSPGMRIGLVIGHEDLVRKITQAKQAADLCSPSLTQRIAGRFLEKYDLRESLKPTIALYKMKKDLMLNELEKNFSDIPGIKWTRPSGGLFIWLCLPEGFNTLEMMEYGKKNGVLFIPGVAFTIDDSCENCMRLSFCLPPEKNIIEGVSRLKKTVVEYGKMKGLL